MTGPGQDEDFLWKEESRGSDDYYKGLKRKDCPYKDHNCRDAWLKGWDDAKICGGPKSKK